MTDQATSSQMPPTAGGTASNEAPTHSSNAGRKRRSCFMCSKRKVKCDKQKPCICCVKAGIECVFPTNAANRNEAGRTPELVDMLQGLEKAVQTLGPKYHEKPDSVLPSAHGLLSHDDGPRIELRLPSAPPATLESATTQTDVEPSNQEGTTELQRTSQITGVKGKASSVSSSHGESPGRIVRDHGKDTYVRRWFWDDGNTEVRIYRNSFVARG